MKILIAGDFAPKDRLAKVMNNSVYEDVLSEVTDIVQAHDYSIVNYLLLGMIESVIMILPITYKTFNLPYNNYKKYNCGV